jgi:hypothetical protein
LIGWGASALLSLVLGASAAPQAAPERYAQLTPRQQLMLRLPVRIRQITPLTQVYDWKESKGPKCLAASSITGAARVGQTSVDLILRDRRRFRAKLESHCPALDYYYGFYINPTVDGLVCAERDIIRSRVGGQCGIERFRSLQAIRRD